MTVKLMEAWNPVGMVWIVWLVLVGAGLVVGLVWIRSGQWRYLRRVKGRKLLSSRELIVNFGVSKEEAERICLEGDRGGKRAELACRAACLRARWASDVFNAVSEECFVDALLRAKKLDAVMAAASTAEEGRVGPLHGVTVTVSDELAVSGLQSVVGTFEHLNDDTAHNDCAAVSALRSAGAVIICKSTVGTAGVNTHDTFSPLLGPTLNSWDLENTVAGPGGGGAVLTSLGVGGLHVGTDALCSAASVAVPAFRFTAERTSAVGELPIPGPRPPLTVMGPNVDAVVVGTSVLTEPLYITPNDPLMFPMPFDQEAYRSTEPLNFAFFRDTNWKESEPSRWSNPALNACRSGLLARGHRVADLEDIGCDAKKLIVLRAALLTAQRLRAVVDSLDPEGHDCFLRALRFWLRLPWFVRWPLAKAIESDPKRQQIAWILHGIDLGMNDANYQSLLKRKELLRVKVANVLINAKIDAVIVPFHPPPRRSLNRTTLVETFGSVVPEFSFFGLPTGVVPLPHPPASSDVEDPSPLLSSDMPITVEVLSPLWQDEVCLRAMAEIESVVPRRPFPQSIQRFRTWQGPLPGGQIATEATPLL